MRLYPFVGPIPNVITFKLYLDLGIWSSETNVHYLVCCLTYHRRTHRSRVGSWDVHVSRISNIEFTIFRSAWISKGSMPKNSLRGSTVRLNTTWGEIGGKVPSLNSLISCESRFFSVYLLTICFSDDLCQDEDANTYIIGSTWSIGDCITCYCHNGVISCSKTLSVITSNEENTERCSQPDCNVAAFLKAKRGICKGKWLWRQSQIPA